MRNLHVEKPKSRSNLRKLLGKKYFIFKRRLTWITKSKSFAGFKSKEDLEYELISHKSFLLRPLKDVEMYLQHNKVKNLELALACINGIILKPGETMSLWKLIGKPTKSKGYLEGLTLESGKISTGIGGGLCQLGNLLYWMTLHSPLKIKERWRHGYDVFPDINRTIPFACGATLSYNYIDFQIENTSDCDFQIKLWLDDEYLNGSLKSNKKSDSSYEVFETDHIIQHQWWGGYTRHNKIWKRIIKLSDNSQHEELVTENNAIMMYNPLLE